MAKKNTQKKLNNKKPLVAIIVGIVAVAIVGTTIAFRSNIVNFFNHAKLGASGATFTEQFVSPTNWKPCDTQPKTVIATNTSNHPIIVRVTYEDYWLTQNNASLPLEQNGLKLGVVNLDHQADWTFNAEDGWYYYNTPLQPGESTNSFMQSVTFNCAYNIGSNELNVCDSEGNCTTPANAYGNANYHVNVTIQTTQDGGDWPKEPICGSSLLYNEIACHTNGTDESINFRKGGTQSGGNGNGIYTRAPYANDTYPLYYYRGEISNNYVIWAGFCWRILRTTDTSGVKIIYDSVAQNNNGVQTCDDGPDVVQSIGDPYPSDPFNYTTGFGTDSPAFSYYMFGGPIWIPNYDSITDGTLPSRTGTTGWFGSEYTRLIGDRWETELTYLGTSLTYANGKYAPAGDILRFDFYPGGWLDGADYSLVTDEMKATYRYLCDDTINMIDNDFCGHGAVLINDRNIFRLLDGELTISEAMEHLQQNTHDSRIKKTIDNWYSSHLTPYTAQLEDTVFCADRRYTGWLANPVYKANSSDLKTTYLGGGSNLTDPRVECPRKHDAFTVHESDHGNGALTYPIALPTLSEAVMAGSVYGYTQFGALGWLNGLNGKDSARSAWTMTPNRVTGAGRDASLYIIGDTQTDGYDNSIAVNSIYIRPVVSLKPGTRFRTGNGTANQPYIIK